MNSMPKVQRQFTPLKITTIYALVGALWILLSDQLLGALVSDPATLTRLQTLKGWLYVIATAWMLHLLIHRNIAAIRTEHERMEEELQARRATNTKLAVITKQQSEIQEWMNTFDTLVGKFDPNGVGIFFNETPIKAGGLTRDEVVGKYFPDTKWWSHSEIERARIVECLEKAKAGLASRIETNFRSADGTPVPIIFNCQPVMDNNGKVKYITAEGKTIIEETRLRTELQEAKENLEIRVRERTYKLVKANEKLTEEIVVRKRAEETLQESEEKFRHLSEEISEGIAVTIDAKNHWVNKAFSDIFGYTQEELIGKGVDFVVVPEEAPILIQRMQDRLEGKDIPSNYETIAKTKDGKRININVSAKLITFEGKQAIQIVVRNITDRKLAEAHIQHLQSVLMAIRDVNQLIVREKNQQKLLQRACEILNQTRNYKLVWIGLIHEGTRDVLPAAQAGFEEGYLRSIKITWDDSDTGKGPTGTAIKTKQPFVMRDISSDPRFKPWKEEAMKRGYVSSAAVPLVYEDKVFGALNVYATFPDSFAEEEIDLLSEVSQDIAFALKTIEIEEEIKRTKEFLQSIIDNTSDLVCTIDLKGNFLSANKAVEKQLGYEEKDLIGRSKIELAVDPELFENVFRAVLEKGSLSNVEMPFRRKDGTIAEILYSVTLLKDKDGHPIAVAGLGKDITERKRAEDVLREVSEKRKELEDIVSQSPAVVFLWRAAEGWPVEFVSDNVQQFGYTPEDFYTGHILFADIVYPDDLERVAAEVARYTQEGRKDFVQEYRIVTQSGEVRWLDDRTWVRRDSKGVITHYQGIALDITKRKQAEKELIEYRESLEQKVKERTQQLNNALTDTEQARAKIDGILKSVADGLIVTDIYNKVILMNRAAEDLLGVRFSDVIDKPVEFAIEEKTLREKFKHTLDKKTTGYQFDFELPGPDTSHPRTMRAITSAIQDKEGRQTGIVTIIHDVTHDREMDKMKTEFISTAAHELRTPLTSIRGFSEILITRDNIGKEERKKFLSYINRQAVNLSRIISDLLDISRIESELGFSLNKARCNARETIKSITSSYQSTSPKHRFDVVLPDKSVELLVDKEKMEQVLINILDNAVKYSPGDSLICVLVEVLGNDCRISVEDHGIGISPEHVSKVFDKFYRVDASDTAPEGTGLGMTIVRYIVEAHGGKVWVESELGKGTTVRLTIPLGLQQ